MLNRIIIEIKLNCSLFFFFLMYYFVWQQKIQIRHKKKSLFVNIEFH